MNGNCPLDNTMQGYGFGYPTRDIAIKQRDIAIWIATNYKDLIAVWIGSTQVM